MDSQSQDLGPWAGSPAPVELSGAWFYPATGDVDFGETTTRLSPKIADLLLALVEADGEVLSKDQLISRVWPDTVVSDDALWRCMSELRSAFEVGGVTSLVETLPRRGYRLLSPVLRYASKDPAPFVLEQPPEAKGRPPALVWGLAALMTLVCLSVGGHLLRTQESEAPEGALPPASRTELVMAQFVERRLEARSLRAARKAPSPDAGMTPAGFDGLVRSGDGADPATGMAKLAHAMHARGRLRTALGLYHSAMDAGVPATDQRHRASLAREAIVRNRAILDGSGHRDAGEAADRSAPELQSSLLAQVETARRLRLDGSHGGSLEALKAVLKADPGFRPAVLELVRVHLAFGNADNARETLRRSLDAAPESVELLTAAAEAELMLGDLEAGLDLLDRACLAWAASRDSVGQEEPEVPRPLLCWL